MKWCGIPSGRSLAPSLSLPLELLGQVGGVGGVTRGLAPAQLLRLARVAQPGPGEDAGDAASQGDLAGAAAQVDSVSTSAHPGVAIPGHLEAFVTLAVKQLCSNKYFLFDIFILNCF